MKHLNGHIFCLISSCDIDFLNSGNNFVLAKLGISTAETIGINQLPLSGTRGQRGSQICFATFILQKNAKLQIQIIQQPLKLDKNKHRFEILRILELFC